MKKPFKETKVGMFLTKPAVLNVVKGVAKSIPFGIGSLAGNLIDEVNGSKPGQVDMKGIYPILLKIAIYIGLVLMVKYGLIDASDAEQIKQALPVE